jgi:hypothetical protein
MELEIALRKAAEDKSPACEIYVGNAPGGVASGVIMRAI